MIKKHFKIKFRDSFVEFNIFGEIKKYCDYQGRYNCSCSHFVATSFSLSSPPSNTHTLWLK